MSITKSKFLIAFAVMASVGCQQLPADTAPLDSVLISMPSTIPQDALTACPERPREDEGEIACHLMYEPVCQVTSNARISKASNSCVACSNRDVIGFLPISYCSSRK